ncbi:MAG: diaminopimelate decarboxylase [Planctomycetia bacterium]|nr:diaminopimelate decarboxylase [Planctomycetia bacterium]
MTSDRFPSTRTQLAGVSLREIARKFGTPTYVYDEASIVEKIQDLKAFDVVRFAQKACSNIAILDVVRRNGVLVDAVSAGEIHRAIKAGFEPHAKADGGASHPIVYTADIFDRESLDAVVKYDIHVNCGSPDMLEQYGKRKPGGDVTLRINPGFGHGHSQKTNTGGEQSKHGIWHEQLDECLRIADRNGLTVTGLHLHIGSGTDLEHLSQVCGAMEKLAAEVGRTLTTISAGGGLPTIYKPGDTYVDVAHYFELWDASRKRLEAKFGHKLTLEIEPGRYLVAESGSLLTEIRAIKQMGKNTFYLLDAGFNNLARPILYGSHHPMSIVPGPLDDASAAASDDSAVAASGTARPAAEVVVGGPLCESGDIFTQEEGGYVRSRSLPTAQVGELLLIECAGAYGFAMGSNYNSKPLAAEVLLRNGAAHLIRARQTPDDLIRGEAIPPA